jgi:tRNA 2-selenouridine synthase
VGRLDGGYKAYRRAVMADLDALPRRFKWRVVCGMTGTGKSRTLRALAQAGAPVLDLEALAAHRGSVLGNMPDEPQPSQKMFDSLVWHALRGLHQRRPIFVESESKKIGRLRVPQSLIECMWSSECIVLEAPMHVRVALLKADYAHYFAAPELLASQLDCLSSLHGSERIRHWQDLARSASWDALVEELLVEHYDPAYTRAISKHYAALSRAPRYTLRDASESEFRRIAAAIIDDIEARRG